MFFLNRVAYGQDTSSLGCKVLADNAVK